MEAHRRTRPRNGDSRCHRWGLASRRLGSSMGRGTKRGEDGVARIGPLMILSAVLLLAMGQRINAALPATDAPRWVAALQEVYQGRTERPAEEAKIFEGPDLPEMALTFDDGPHPGKTERLLSVLKRLKVPATFFVIGKMVERSPALTRRIVRMGHQLGNHSYSHVTLTDEPETWIEGEYRACNQAVFQATGVRMTFCRPPGGDYDRDVIRASVRQGLTTALWSDDPADYDRPAPDRLLRRTVYRFSPGGIILLHDGI
ncbi:polysaccharide deacetylase family protein [bacterium]|nr:MAG: polysaccharide deacetylase family protein [bacterium]